jgi:hypothetical protein
MSNRSRWQTSAIALALMACNSTPGLATDHAGRDINDWMEAYLRSAITRGSPIDGDVTFIPIPLGTDPEHDRTYTGALDTTLGAGQWFALSLVDMVGESHDDGTPPDVADDYATRDVFVGIHARIMLDDVVLLDTTAGDSLEPYYFDTPFDPIVRYPEPTHYHANAAIWARGVGILHSPLASGVHTLHILELLEDANIAYDNTWTITVP